jgi:phosphoglycolate phosphatase-like HAD superfamily hydrolase
MPIGLVIFDLDGTLVDTARDITSSLNEALRHHVGREFTLGETTSMIGEGLTRLIEKAMGRTGGADPATVGPPLRALAALSLREGCARKTP